jgi:hypothetical protein
MNLARIKFFGMFICALCKVQTVGYEKPAVAFETEAKACSSLRRIQRFDTNVQNVLLSLYRLIVM